MAKKVDKPAAAPDTILVGPCQIGRKWLETDASVQDYRPNGCVLVDERQKHTIKVGDMPVVVSITLTITREPVGNDEAARCSELRDTRDKDRKAKEAEEAERLAKEKRAMFQLGQESASGAVFGTLGQIDKLMAVGEMVNRLTQGKLNPPQG